jgi:putative membrane protein
MAEHQEAKQIEMMRHMVSLAEEQVTLSAQRSEKSEFRSFLNAERTLSVWVRTALSLMIVGLAIDRFGLLVHHGPGAAAPVPSPRDALLDAASTWTCMALVALGVLMVLATGVRFIRYARDWRDRHQLPANHGPYLAPFFALMVALFGVVLLVIMAMAAP